MNQELNLNLNILVVDDMKAVLKLYKNILEEMGFKNITYAEDGDLAWEILKNKYSMKDPIDLVISDLNMPRVSGLELLKKCRKDEHFANILFVMATAVSEQSEVINTLKAGANNYIVKPFQRDVLEKILSMLFL